MRIAIATYGDLISPRFDCASTLRVLEWDVDPVARREERLQLDSGYCHADALLQQNVSALLCGGIRRCDYQRLADAGLQVIAGQYGPYLDVFREYLAGRLESQPSWERPRGCGPRHCGPGQGRGMGRGQGQGMGQGMGMGQGRGGGMGGGRGQGQGPGRGTGQGRGMGGGMGGGRGGGGGRGAGGDSGRGQGGGRGGRQR